MLELFLNFFFVVFLIAIIHNVLPQRTLPLCLTVKVPLFSSQGDKLTCEKKSLTYHFPEADHSQRCFVRLKALWLYFPTSSPLYSAFWLQFLIASLSDYIKESGIYTSTIWLLWDISLPSSSSVSFPNEVIFLASTLCLPDSLACHMVSRMSLDLVPCPRLLLIRVTFNVNFFFSI